MNISQELPNKIMALLEDYGDVGEEYKREAVNPYLQSLRETQFGMQEAAQVRDRPESKFHRYADPITAGLAGLAFILDKTSGKQMRRMTAGPKLADITGGIRERRAERGAKRQEKYGQRLKEIEMEHGLKGAEFGAKTGLAEIKERGIGRKITGAKVAASLRPTVKEPSYSDKQNMAARESERKFLALPGVSEMGEAERVLAFRKYDFSSFKELDYDVVDWKTPEEYRKDTIQEIELELDKIYRPRILDAMRDENPELVKTLRNERRKERKQMLMSRLDMSEEDIEALKDVFEEYLEEKGDIPTSAPFDMSKFLQATAEGSPVLLDIFSKTYGSDTEKFISEPPSVGRSDTQGRVYNPYLYGR